MTQYFVVGVVIGKRTGMTDESRYGIKGVWTFLLVAVAELHDDHGYQHNEEAAAEADK